MQDLNEGCPHCPGGAKYDPKPPDLSQCTMNRPLSMVIPPQGVHLSCPVHPAGHHIFGSQVRC